MDSFKTQIQRQLVANVIKDKCAQNSKIIFRDAWSTQERVIRFTTPFFRNLFDTEEKESGQWHTGDFVMYEANNDIGSFCVECVYSPKETTYEQKRCGDSLVKVCRAKNENDLYLLKSWDISPKDNDPNSLFDAFDSLLGKEIPDFEAYVKDNIYPDTEESVLKEGSAEYVTHLSYERNAKARAACIAAHGAVCAVCGMDFGKTYGPDFAGQIEVHHIVPLSKISKQYTVDPVKDLIPVCPNCHTALHSKKDGVYTIEELKRMRANHGE